MNPNTHTVAPHETLTGIASANKTTVQALLAANPDIKNPDLIFSGSQINLPGAPVQTTPAASPTVAQPPQTAAADTANPAAVDPDQATKDAVAKELGYSDFNSFAQDTLQKPGLDTEKLYNDSYAAQGLPKVLQDITDKKTKLNEALGVVNDNPWYDEAFRKGEAGRLQDLAGTDIKNLEDLYNTKLGSVNDLVTRESSDFSANEAVNAKKLDYLHQAVSAAQTQREKGAAAAADAKAAAQKVQTVTVGTNGKLYAVDPVTHEFKLVGTGNPPAAKGGSGSGSTGGSTTATTGNIATDVDAVLSGRNTLYNIRQTMGRTNAAAAYMQQMRAAITHIDPNFDFVASDAGGKAVSSTYYQKASAAINAVLPNIDKIVDLSNQVSRVGITGVDKLLQNGQVAINNQKVSNFHQAQKLIADEIGVALGAGGVSDMKLQLGFDVTDPSVSQEVFASNMALVKDFLQNRRQGLEDLRYKSSTVSGGGSTDLSTVDSDIAQAIHDTANFNSREDLISALVSHYGISQDAAAQKVYSKWTDNTKR